MIGDEEAHMDLLTLVVVVLGLLLALALLSVGAAALRGGPSRVEAQRYLDRMGEGDRRRRGGGTPTD
jgi:hypothetical protein